MLTCGADAGYAGMLVRGAPDGLGSDVFIAAAEILALVDVSFGERRRLFRDPGCRPR